MSGARTNDQASDPSPEPGARTSALAPRWAVIGIFILLLVGVLAEARAFLMPTVLAFLLTLVFSPVRRFFERRGVPPAATAFGITVALLALVLAGMLALSGPVAQWVEDAPRIGREIENKLRDFQGAAEGMRQAAEQVDSLGSNGSPDVQRVVIEQPGMAASLALMAPSVFAQVMFTLILMLFLLSSGDMIYEKIVHAMPTFRDKRLAMKIAHDIERKLSRYLSTITAINAGLGVCVALAMWAMGMPNPILFGALAFVLNFIPYVGSAAAVALAGVVALVSFEQPWDALIVVAVFLSLTSLEGQLVTPYFVGRSLQLNTVVVFLSVSLWAWLWSVMGMLVATPLLVTIRTFCEHIPGLENFGSFLSARGAERPDEPEEEAPKTPPGT